VHTRQKATLDEGSGHARCADNPVCETLPELHTVHASILCFRRISGAPNDVRGGANKASMCAFACCHADTFTTVAEGCDLNPQGYFAHSVGFNMNPGVKVRLAKFEVCEPGSCFNPAYEAAKQASAKTCTALADQPGKNDWKCN